ncbi:hypothetical protein [Nitrosopumilus sp.]|uniref:hypothetical protein n=1 Tax=Nitrosopumilus sp. TaxID=2024843 RepID=UPI00247CB6EB|nr:hypothetical protein [Nitrosopumilus sp.]MCV0410107.1 hypothetical protein [Nitrosopumilus sp.]
MELKKERHIVRLALIISIISGVSYLGVLFLDSSNYSNNAVLGTEIAVSGFGEIRLFNPQQTSLFSTDIYQDSHLGFQISKPNNDWDIHPVTDELNSNESISLQTKGFIDGVYVETNHNKEFMLTVFDIKNDEFSLHEFVDQQISEMESQENNIVLFEQVSPNNDWALFAVESSGNISYGEQLLFLKENRLYMLQYSGDSPQSMDSDLKNDLKFIMDSFEVI